MRCIIFDLLLQNCFPRIWIPSPEERDLRQPLRHRHKMVCLRTSLANKLHALAMGQGICRKQKLWAERGRVRSCMLSHSTLWTDRRRQGLLEMLDRVDPVVNELDRKVIQTAE
jgi:transposase